MYWLFKAGFSYMEKDCHDYEDKLFDLSNLLCFMNMIYLPFTDYLCNGTWGKRIFGSVEANAADLS